MCFLASLIATSLVEMKNMNKPTIMLRGRKVKKIRYNMKKKKKTTLKQEMNAAAQREGTSEKT